MVDMHIEIVSSSVVGLSSMGKESRNAILAVLSRHYTNVGITIVNNLSDLQNLVSQKPDLVFLGMKFIPLNPSLGQDDPNKIWIESYLNDQGILCTGSGQDAHELELNKHLAKQCILDAGLMTSPFYVASQGSSVQDETLSFPLFVKPTNRGGGLGIDSQSVVHDFQALESKIKSIRTKLQADSLVEEYLPGREFSVALLRHEYSEEYSAMPIELIAPLDEHGDRVLSAKVKSADTEMNAEVTDAAVKSVLSALAMDVFEALGARDYGRIDIRLNKLGVPQFLEANLIPSLINNYGNFPKACKLNLGLDYEPMLLQIVRLALTRNSTVYEGVAEPYVPVVLKLGPLLEV